MDLALHIPEGVESANLESGGLESAGLESGGLESRATDFGFGCLQSESLGVQSLDPQILGNANMCNSRSEIRRSGL